MARYRHLQHAPITEALVDMRVRTRDGLTIERLRQAIVAEEFGYYLKGPIAQGTIAFRLDANGTASQEIADAQQIGVRLHSRDEKYVAQFQLGGFTLSRLAPYEDWSTLVGECKRLWSVYLQALKPAAVIRIATRFINNLRLPMETGASYQISDLLTYPP